MTTTFIDAFPWIVLLALFAKAEPQTVRGSMDEGQVLARG
jgi:hypothetical protein